MHQLLVVGDERARPDEVTSALADLFEIDVREISAVRDFAPKQHTLIDVDLDNAAQLLPLKEWLKRKPQDAKVVFVTDKASRLHEARAAALGATGTIHYPIDRQTLLGKFWGKNLKRGTATRDQFIVFLQSDLLKASDAGRSLFEGGFLRTYGKDGASLLNRALNDARAASPVTSSDETPPASKPGAVIESPTTKTPPAASSRN